MKYLPSLLAFLLTLLATPASPKGDDATFVLSTGMKIPKIFLETEGSFGENYVVIAFDYKTLKPITNQGGLLGKHHVRAHFRNDLREYRRPSAAELKEINFKTSVYITDPGEWSSSITSERISINGLHVKYQFDRTQKANLSDIDEAIEKLIENFMLAGARE